MGVGIFLPAPVCKRLIMNGFPFMSKVDLNKLIVFLRVRGSNKNQIYTASFKVGSCVMELSIQFGATHLKSHTT